MMPQPVLSFLGMALLALIAEASEIPPPAASVFLVGNSSDSGSKLTYNSNHEPNKILLNDIVNTEVEVESGKNIELECAASLPVQWSYHGSGRPAFIANVLTDQLNNKEVHKATLHISNANDRHSGLYICSYAEFPRIFSTYHVYVPGSEIFIPHSGRTISYSTGMHYVTIPCPVSVKSAKVILRRVHVDNSLRTLDPAAAVFDPKLGFKLNIRDMRDPSGTYVCSGTSGGRLRLREYILKSQTRNQTSAVTFPDGLQEDINPCLSYACPSLSVCRVNLNTNLPFCACRSKSTALDTNCTRLCKTTSECPKSEKCQYSVEKQLKMCIHVCQDHKCVENADCLVDEQKGGPKCRCRRGFQGNGNLFCERIPFMTDEDSSYCSPAKCGPRARCQVSNGRTQCVCGIGAVGVWPDCEVSCTSDDDCDLQDHCNEKGICKHVCTDNMCAPMAECKVVSRKPQCLCPPGYTGKATEACYLSHYYYSSRSELGQMENGDDAFDGSREIVGTTEDNISEIEEKPLKLLMPENNRNDSRSN